MLSRNVNQNSIEQEGVSTSLVGGPANNVGVEDEHSTEMSCDSEENSDCDEGVSRWGVSEVHSKSYVRRRRIWKSELRGKGQIFASHEAFKHSLWKYALGNQFNFNYVRNCKQRIAVKCQAEGCPFYICARGNLKRPGVIVKEFVAEHVHSVGHECNMSQWGRRRMRAELLAQLIEAKVRLSADYAPSDIIQDLELEIGVKVTYMQSWRTREFVCMMVAGRPEDHYKLLPWMCSAIIRATPDSVVFCELDGSRFKRMFVAYGACINAFLMGCRPILFVDGTHLSGPYNGTLLAACGLDADNHLYNFAYAIVSAENNEEWFWFLTKLKECLGLVRPVIMSDRHQGLLTGVPKVFGSENHSYCVRHLTENFLKEAAKFGIRREVSRLIAKEMFNRVAYATTHAEYNIALEELRKYKRELAAWVEANEPNH